MPGKKVNLKTKWDNCVVEIEGDNAIITDEKGQYIDALDLYILAKNWIDEQRKNELIARLKL